MEIRDNGLKYSYNELNTGFAGLNLARVTGMMHKLIGDARVLRERGNIKSKYEKTAWATIMYTHS